MFNQLHCLLHLYSLDLDCFHKAVSVTTKCTDTGICFYQRVPFQCCNYTTFNIAATSTLFPRKVKSKTSFWMVLVDSRWHWTYSYFVL